LAGGCRRATLEEAGASVANAELAPWKRDINNEGIKKDKGCCPEKRGSKTSKRLPKKTERKKGTKT